MNIYEKCPEFESERFLIRLFHDKDCEKSEHLLIGKTGYAYDGYWTIE